MSKIKNAALDQYGAKPFKQQQFGTAGAERVNRYQQRTDQTGINTFSDASGCFQWVSSKMQVSNA